MASSLPFATFRVGARERGGRGAGALTMGGDYYSLIGGLLDDLDRKRVEVRRGPPTKP